MSLFDRVAAVVLATILASVGASVAARLADQTDTTQQSVCAMLWLHIHETGGSLPGELVDATGCNFVAPPTSTEVAPSPLVIP